MNLRQKCKKQKQYIERLERNSLLINRTVIYTKESLEHLKIKRNIITDDYVTPNDSEDYFKELTINQISRDMSTELGKYVEFNDEEGYATLDVWVRKKMRGGIKLLLFCLMSGDILAVSCGVIEVMEEIDV